MTMIHFTKSLRFKVTLLVITVELVIFAGLGVFYTYRFSQEIDKAIIARLSVPGLLMTRGDLSFDAVSDKRTMEGLLSEPYREGIVIGLDGQVYFSSIPARLDTHLDAIDGLRLPGPESSAFSVGAPDLITPVQDSTGTYLTSLSPLRPDGKLTGYLYLKVGTEMSEAEKRKIAILFAIGSLGTIALTVPILSWLLHLLVIRRLNYLVEIFRCFARGDYAARAQPLGGDDEIATLMNGFNGLAKRMEDTMANLSESESRFRVLVERAPEAILVYDVDAKHFVDANQNAERLFACSREQLRLASSTTLYAPVQTEKMPAEEGVDEYLRRALVGEEVVVERAITNASGRQLLCEVRLVLLPASTSRLIRASYLDITERKRAEEMLRQANMVVENSPVVLFRWLAKEGWPVEMVSKNVTQFGYTPEEFLSGSVPFASLVHPDDLELVASEVGEYTAAGLDSFQQEYRIVTRDGVVHWIDDRTVIERDTEGRVTHYQGIVMDITERRLAEDALRESEEKFRVLAETSPTGIIVYQGAHFVYVNPSAVRLFGYSETELLGMYFWEWAHPDQREMVMNRGMARQRGEQVPAQYEQRFVKKSGEEGWVIVSAGSIEYQGKPAGIATFVDITETKRSEERVSDALAEKVVLLKEVHHRVKNNLQIISSLLDLQSEAIRDEKTLRTFRESQNRIQAMALIHQKLYQSESLAFIDLREYIEELSNYLYSASVKDPNLIHLRIEVGEVLLGMDEAIPCGLIINELISNSLKHAFPEGRAGEICIRCGIEDGWIVLAVSDTGIGLPLGLDAGSTETLGLQLVTMLVKQLRGRISVGSEQAGTVFSITFPGSSHEGAMKV
ncbi:MAG: PAS domain S-box protein [Deltaproteobacteria bacterium]|nr:PAS domain S-box protein [Deltaproteobacteria bacterium]